MKRIAFIILLIAGCFTVGVAQKQHGGMKKGHKPGEPGKFLQEMTNKLSLSSEQQDKVKNILSEGRTAMKASREKYKGNKKCMAQAKFQNRKAVESKILAVLNPEQQAKFQEEKRIKIEKRRKKKEEELSRPIDCGK